MLLLLQLQNQGDLSAWSNLLSRSAVSCIFVLLTQLALCVAPLFVSASSLFLQLTLSALVLLVLVGSGRWFRRLLGVNASAPAFVFFNILFVWGVYIAIIRQATSRILDILFNGEIILLIIGLCSIMSKDPGFVTHEPSRSDKLVDSSVFGVEIEDESTLLKRRIRYCKICKTYVKGFDHHCPAFGTCIGKKNYVLFMVLLVGFLTTEASYIMCTSQFARNYQVLQGIGLEPNLTAILANSTMLFSLFQVLWQGVFLTWHVYCVCFNIRTDEWINWRNYPEFKLIAPTQSGEDDARMRFRNPYDQGILHNVREFFRLEA